MVRFLCLLQQGVIACLFQTIDREFIPNTPSPPAILPPRSQRAAGLVMKAPALAGECHLIQNYQQAEDLLSPFPIVLGCCKILLSSGVGNIFFSGVDTDYTTALALLEEEESIGVIICDAYASNLLSIKESVLRSSENLKERIAVVCQNHVTSALASVESINCERIVMVYANSSSPLAEGSCREYSAAALASLILSENNPIYNFNGAVIPLLSDCEKTAEADIQSLLGAGISVLENTGGQVECIRTFTTSSQNNGAPDNSLRPLNTILVIDDVLQSIRKSLKSRLKGTHLVRQTLERIASQTVVELDAKQDAGIILDYEIPTVYSSSEDPSVCIVELTFTCAHIISQIHISAHITV